MLREVAEYFQIGVLRKARFYRNDQESAATDLIVGVANSFHDGAIAVLHDDEVHAEALERPAQLKRSMLVASQYYATRSLLGSFLKRFAQSDKVIRILFRFTWGPNVFVRIVGDVYIRLLRLRARFPLRSLPPELPPSIVYSTRLPQIWFWDSYLFPTHTFRSELFPQQRVEIRNRTTKHHMTHAANAVYTSPFEECAVMVLDGQGEWHSLSCFHYAKGRFEPVGFSRASLGLLYADVTALCGFSPAEGEEWKVMGLAAYGSLDQKIYDFFRAHTRIDGLNVRLSLTPRSFRKLRELCGGFRSPGDKDIMRAAHLARSFQDYFADVIVEVVTALHKAVPSKNLAYAGGCALNSAANGRIVGQTGFTRLHVPSAPADDGNALGAALWERHQVRGMPYTPRVMSPYLGSEADEAELAHLLSFGGIPHRKMTNEAEICEVVAELLAQGKIVGVMQGRAEFGPRALGNRSLLADPRRADIKNEINRLVKFREDYRPLAPSVLHEHGAEYFDPYQFSPYMERALPFRAEVRSKVPAVVHADGTGRLQSVTRELNPRYHAIIAAFYAKTGVPMVVNTSLNVMGKPIVHGVRDAVQLMYTTGLDYLLINDTLLSKRNAL